MASFVRSKDKTLIVWPYIGDTRDDVGAAEHAELTPIFCRWGYGKSLDGHWADCIQRPSDILDLVD